MNYSCATKWQIVDIFAFHSLTIPRVETGKNTSTVIPASCKRRRKGNPIVSVETVMHGYVSSATLATDRLHYKLQTRPLVREGAPRRRAKQFSCKKKGKSKIWSWATKGCPTPRRTDRLTVSRKVTSTSTYNIL
jgi:hypothetical protein